MLRTHREVFTEYLRDASRFTDDLGRSSRQDWREWLGDNGLCQCAGCKKYGTYGDEISLIADDPIANPGVHIDDAMYCADCTVNVWGWTNAKTFLTVECPKGEESYWLLAQAKLFNDESGLLEWGYQP